MPAWWDSIDSVSTFTWWLRWLGIALTVLGALCGGLALISTKRLDTLKATRDNALQARLLAAEERQKERHLTPEQREKILATLRQNPQGSFAVRVVNTREAQVFADELSEVMVEAGWVRGKRDTVIGGKLAGLGVAPQNAEIPRATVLFLAFQEAGLSVWPDVLSEAPPDSVILYVGEKP